MSLEPEASVLSCSSSPRRRIRKRLSGSWLSCCCVGGGSVCLLTMGRVIMERYWTRSCIRIRRHSESSIFPSTLLSLILLSRVGSRLRGSFQTESSCRCRLQNIICVRHSKTKSLCPACSNIYLISYKCLLRLLA